MSGRAHLGLLGPPCPGGDRFPPEGVGINGVARGRGDRVTVTSSALAKASSVLFSEMTCRSQGGRRVRRTLGGRVTSCCWICSYTSRYHGLQDKQTGF